MITHLLIQLSSSNHLPTILSSTMQTTIIHIHHLSMIHQPSTDSHTYPPTHHPFYHPATIYEPSIYIIHPFIQIPFIHSSTHKLTQLPSHLINLLPIYSPSRSTHSPSTAFQSRHPPMLSIYSRIHHPPIPTHALTRGISVVHSFNHCYSLNMAPFTFIC